MKIARCVGQRQFIVFLLQEYLTCHRWRMCACVELGEPLVIYCFLCHLNDFDAAVYVLCLLCEYFPGPMKNFNRFLQNL